MTMAETVSDFMVGLISSVAAIYLLDPVRLTNLCMDVTMKKCQTFSFLSAVMAAVPALASLLQGKILCLAATLGVRFRGP